MKQCLLAALLAVASTPAFAANWTCSDTSNSDYVLTLVADANLGFIQASLQNVDWGAGGQGDVQALTKINPSEYVVVTVAKSRIGLTNGTHIWIQGKTLWVGPDFYSCL